MPKHWIPISKQEATHLTEKANDFDIDEIFFMIVRFDEENYVDILLLFSIIPNYPDKEESSYFDASVEFSLENGEVQFDDRPEPIGWFKKGETEEGQKEFISELRNSKIIFVDQETFKLLGSEFPNPDAITDIRKCWWF